MIGKKVIIRADRAGVFYGVLKEKNGSEVTLTDCEDCGVGMGLHLSANWQ